MVPYKNKSKCGYNCQKRAKWRAQDGFSIRYACNDHKFRLEGMPDPEVHVYDENESEAMFSIRNNFGI